MSTAIAETKTGALSATGNDPGTLISMIARAAADPAVSIDKMERLFAMHQQMEAAQRKTAYQVAMATTQAEIGPVVKDRKNDHTKSKYATLEAIDDAIRPIYTAHGFSLSFDAPETTDKGLLIACDVLHNGGHSERKTLVGALDTVGPNGSRNKTDIQGMGSTVSYLRRYLTCMIFNVVIRNEDKDGNTVAAITGHQYAEIMEKLALVDGDPERFAGLFNVPTVADIPAKRFDEAIRKIEDRSKKIAAEKFNGA